MQFLTFRAWARTRTRFSPWFDTEPLAALSSSARRIYASKVWTARAKAAKWSKDDKAGSGSSTRQRKSRYERWRSIRLDVHPLEQARPNGSLHSPAPATPCG